MLTAGLPRHRSRAPENLRSPAWDRTAYPRERPQNGRHERGQHEAADEPLAGRSVRASATPAARRSRWRPAEPEGKTTGHERRHEGRALDTPVVAGRRAGRPTLIRPAAERSPWDTRARMTRPTPPGRSIRPAVAAAGLGTSVPARLTGAARRPTRCARVCRPATCSRFEHPGGERLHRVARPPGEAALGERPWSYSRQQMIVIRSRSPAASTASAPARHTSPGPRTSAQRGLDSAARALEVGASLGASLFRNRQDDQLDAWLNRVSDGRVESGGQGGRRAQGHVATA